MNEQGENNIGLPAVERPAAAIPESRVLRMNPLGFVVLALAAIFFLYQVVGGGITLLLFGQSVTSDNVQWMRVATMLAQIVFLLIPTLILMRVPAWLNTLLASGSNSESDGVCSRGSRSVFPSAGNGGISFFSGQNSAAGIYPPVLRDDPQIDRRDVHDAGAGAFAV